MNKLIRWGIYCPHPHPLHMPLMYNLVFCFYYILAKCAHYTYIIVISVPSICPARPIQDTFMSERAFSTFTRTRYNAHALTGLCHVMAPKLILD
jgi:hypothetical protein